ncbi:hypothetical protein LSH36_40g20006 [Paralvinella palmiformis]|uniref:Major facilitator superfamily associated domain-containing protein n=1 Tax=Paralvinella palmiformis TaxID=53620 RepID=A0AAD9K7A4_9ANNE|nr:hypothetical protein LSH36_40g20006 [Paralvinella palmiformis]
MSNDHSIPGGEINEAFETPRDSPRDRKMAENEQLVVDLKKTYDSNGTLAISGDNVNDENNDNGDDPDDVSKDDRAEHGESSTSTCCQCCLRCRCSRLCVPPIAFCAIFHFSFVGAYGCVLPYISIYMKQIGLSPQQIGLISGLRPIVGFCSAPLWGALGDQFRIRRLLLVLSLASWLAFFVGLFHIPPPDHVDSCPTDIVVVQRAYSRPLLRRGLLAADNQTDSILSVVESFLHLLDSRAVDNNDTDGVVRGWTTDEIDSMTMYRGWMYKPDSLWRVFITCLCLIVAGEIFQSPASALSDTATLHTLERVGLSLDNYGYVRAWGALGYGISSSSSGGVSSSGNSSGSSHSDSSSSSSSSLRVCTLHSPAGALVSSSRRMEVLCGVKLYFSDYRLLTYIFMGFLVISFVAATQIKFKEREIALSMTDPDVDAMRNPQVKDKQYTMSVLLQFFFSDRIHDALSSKEKEEESIELKDTNKQKSEVNSDVTEQTHNAGAVIRIFFNMHYGSWLATSFFVGICNGVIWGFLYWHLDNLGASQFLMGVSGIVVCASEFVMFFLVGKVIKLLGYIGIMYLGLLGYTVRFCIYAVIRNPWWVLPAEVLQGITFSIVWVSMTAYTTMAVPSASLATIQGILHGVYFGLGSGSGHLIGGIMIGYVGSVITFFSFAGASLFVLILFAVAQKCSTKPEDVYGYYNLDGETAKITTSKPEEGK